MAIVSVIAEDKTIGGAISVRELLVATNPGDHGTQADQGHEQPGQGQDDLHPIATSPWHERLDCHPEAGHRKHGEQRRQLEVVDARLDEVGHW